MFQVSYVKWKEPKEYIEFTKRIYLSDKSKLQRLKCPLIVFFFLFLSFMLNIYSKSIRPGYNGPNIMNSIIFVFLGSALITGIQFLLIRYAHYLGGPEIEIQDDRIIRSHLSNSFYKYKDIKNFGFNNFSFENFSCYELVLELKKKSKLIKIGLDNEELKNKVIMILEGQGLTFKD